MRINLRPCRSERGAVLVIVAGFMLVAALFMAFVVDIGNQRQNRRQLTTATDAPALAVAYEWANEGGDPAFDCDSSMTAEPLAQDNNPRPGQLPASYDCRFDAVTPFRGGIVSVASREDVDYAFDGVTGVEASSVGSVTRVKIEPLPGGGVRPVALCTGDLVGADPTGLLTLEQRLALGGWMQESSDNTVWSASALTTEIELTNTTGNSTNPCRANGNWNAVVFRDVNECPGQSNPAGGASTFRDQYANGSPFDVAVNDCVSRLPGNGGFSSGQPEVLEEMYVWFPVFDSALNGGAGIYKVVGFVEAFVNDVSHHGNQTTFDLTPTRFMTSGTCCLLNEDNLYITLCDVGTLSGGRSLTSDIDCQPRDTTGNPIDPGLVDPCLVTNVQPDPALVPVDGSGTVAEVRSVTVSVVDYDRCASVTVDAVDGPLRTGATFVGRLNNEYQFEFRPGDQLRVAGTELNLEVRDGGDLLDDAARLQTIAYVPPPPPPPCVVSSFTVNPAAPQNNPQHSLVGQSSTISVTASVNNGTSCAGLTIRVVRQTPSPDRLMFGTQGAGFSLNYTNTGNENQWFDGVYRVEAEAGGLPVGPPTTFTVN